MHFMKYSCDELNPNACFSFYGLFVQWIEIIFEGALHSKYYTSLNAFTEDISSILVWKSVRIKSLSLPEFQCVQINQNVKIQISFWWALWLKNISVISVKKRHLNSAFLCISKKLCEIRNKDAPSLKYFTTLLHL